jgi:GTP-binding protein
MLIKETRFIKSSPKLELCPSPDLPEYAFIGRSNVGKSSLINMLVGEKKLAKISATPGKTQLINHFLINDNWYLVDLPGYGYAKVSKTKREKWSKLINYYITGRDNLMNVFLLIDSRIPPQKNDLAFFEFLGEQQLPFTVLFTKTDKITAGILKKNIETYRNELLKSWEYMPAYIITSAIKKTGREKILSFINQTNKFWEK